MIQEVRTYKCEGIPQDVDLSEALTIVKEAAMRHEPFMLELKWFVPYSGSYKIQITEEDTIKTLRNKLPKVYGM